MLRARNEVGTDITKIIENYRGPVFGYASMNFYSEFLAAVDVYNNHEQYFGTLALDKPVPDRAVTPKAAVVRTAAVKPAAAASKYKVRTGDTLYEIAQRFGTSIRELMDMNKLSKPAIYVGQMLLVK
jgi:LysM repeat protein